jgi:hypothetical protein
VFAADLADVVAEIDVNPLVALDTLIIAKPENG